MNLASDRFYNSSGLHKGADGKVRPSHTYSYETHTTLYDIVKIEGLLFVSVNCGKLSNLICDWTPIHYRIESHFGL